MTLKSCLNQSLTVKVTVAHYPLPSLRVRGNAAVKPLPAVNNGTPCVKVPYVSVCVCTYMCNSCWKHVHLLASGHDKVASCSQCSKRQSHLQVDVPAAAVHSDHAPGCILYASAFVMWDVYFFKKQIMCDTVGIWAGVVKITRATFIFPMASLVLSHKWWMIKDKTWRCILLKKVSCCISFIESVAPFNNFFSLVFFLY